ncbi:MAG: nucleotide exchange factor GrpE [Acidobacteria bacterium]|jgi:molecular chaperone GrpE|nr:MAG: nucleotide exchange factor GrpE [Acidobacteriota bacterium]GIU81311.1 MAG: hypothetical protein KatS3mg006_0375 [Pyrinomonadaceae bacterium]
MDNENTAMKDQNISLDEFLRELEEKDFCIDGLDGIVEIEAYELDADNENLAIAGKPISNVRLNDREAINERMRQLERERDEIAEFLNRQQRDFENYKRRVERERSNVMDNIMTDFAKKILPIVDNLDRAIDAARKVLPEKSSEEFKHFLEGIVLVNQQLYELLAEMGVEPIPSVGERFDPHLHEAVVAERSSQFPHNTIVAELLRGYRIGEKVIRHALVKVAINNSSGQNTEAAQA